MSDERPQTVRLRMAADFEATRARAVVFYRDTWMNVVSGTDAVRKKLYSVEGPREPRSADPPASQIQRETAVTFRLLAELLEESAVTMGAFEAASAALALADQKP